MQLSFYQESDYQELTSLYKDLSWFDPVTDSQEKLTKQIEKNPQSILLVRENEKIVGTVTLLFTGRLGLFFRLIARKQENEANIREFLLSEGEKIFLENGYSEVHILAPEQDTQRQEEYEKYDFQKGRLYRWFWKKISTIS